MHFKSHLPKKLGKNNLHGQSDFDYAQADGGFMVIIDLDLGNRSVTNDLNNVVDTLVEKGYNLYEMKVIYRDSTGLYDAVLINADNTLYGIASLYAKTQNEAFYKYNERVIDQCLVPHTSLNPC